MSAGHLPPKLVIYAMMGRTYQIEHYDSGGRTKTVASNLNREEMVGALVAFVYGGVTFEGEAEEPSPFDFKVRPHDLQWAERASRSSGRSS